MSWKPYTGDDYLNYEEIDDWCRALAKAHPQWVTLEEVGASLCGRPLLLLTLGDHHKTPSDQPAFWLDGGTHAAEWTGVMATLYAVSKWVTALIQQDAEAMQWFGRHTIYVMPCISPDGYKAMIEGSPFIRSTVRPPPQGTVRSGMEPCDMDGDGVVRFMRWQDPAGAFIIDPDVPTYMRPRRIDDKPEDAWMLCVEGQFINWDGIRWTAAPLENGLDLNRNFPAAWAPFSMFGMDGGRYPLSAPESRTVVSAFSDRPNVAAALTNHTYTGALLMSPYRESEKTPSVDIKLMEALAEDAVEGTDYRVMKVYPDFVYDKNNSIVGVWDDALTSVFGVVGYTLELWDPFRHAGVDNPKPAEFFSKPDQATVKKLFEAFSDNTDAYMPWQDFEHPQLGTVQIGGLDYMRTIRNPPEALLAEECERGFKVANTIRRALPRADAQVHVKPSGDELHSVTIVLENVGFLPTSSLSHAENIGACLPCTAEITVSDGLEVISGEPAQQLDHLDGWGHSRTVAATNSLYPSLPTRGHRDKASWTLRGEGTITITWQAGRAGRDIVNIAI